MRLTLGKSLMATLHPSLREFDSDDVGASRHLHTIAEIAVALEASGPALYLEASLLLARA